MNLQVSDLFKVRGHKFDWNQRVADQHVLVARLDATENPQLRKIAEDIKEFANGGIASIVYLDMILEEITKVCSKSNISMS